MNKPITPELLNALDSLKHELDLPTDYALCKHFSIPRPTMSQWRNGKSGRTMGYKWWRELRPHLEPYLTGEKAYTCYEVKFASEVLSALNKGNIDFAKSMLKHVIDKGIKQ